MKYFVGLRNINSINNIWYMHYYYTHFIHEKKNKINGNGSMYKYRTWKSFESMSFVVTDSSFKI